MIARFATFDQRRRLNPGGDKTLLGVAFPPTIGGFSTFPRIEKIAADLAEGFRIGTLAPSRSADPAR